MELLHWLFGKNKETSKRKLHTLDSKITAHRKEIHRLENTLSRQKWNVWFLSLLLLILAACYLIAVHSVFTTSRTLLIATLLLPCLPLLLFRPASVLMRWRLQRHAQALEDLQLKLENEIEALKQRSSYSEIHALLQKYAQTHSAQTPAQTQQEDTWIDSALSCIVGELSSDQKKYALVCAFCKTHNGLVSQAQYLELVYLCPACNKTNSQREILAAAPQSPASS